MAVNTVDSLAIHTYDSNIEPSFQATSMMMGKFMTKPTSGEDIRFQISGQVQAGTKKRFDRMAPEDVMYNKPVAKVAPYYVNTVLDEFDDSVNNLDVAANNGITLGEAMGRRYDQLIFDQLHAGKTADSFGDVQTYALKAKDSLKNEDMAEIHQMFTTKSIPVNPTDVCLFFPANWYKDLATETNVASQDFTTGKVTMSGKFPPLHGIQLVEVDERVEGGLRRSNGAAQSSAASSAGNGFARAYAVHRKGIGIAMGTLKGGSRGSSITWQEWERLWLFQHWLCMGTCTLQNQAIIQITSP